MNKKYFRQVQIVLIFLTSLLVIPSTLSYWNSTSGDVKNISLHIQIGEWIIEQSSDKPIGSLFFDEYEAGNNNQWQVIYFEEHDLLVLVTKNWVFPAEILTSGINYQISFGLTWLPYRSNPAKYAIGAVVKHQGDYYRVSSGDAWSNDVPGVSPVWEPLNLSTLAYDSSNTYVLHDVVTYNGHIYQIISNSHVAAANSNAPGITSHSWQQLDGFYSATNVYQTNDIVVYQNRIYRSLLDDNLATPSDLSNTSKWVRYVDADGN